MRSLTGYVVSFGGVIGCGSGFNRVKQVPCEVARSNKQWVEACLYHKGDQLTHDRGYKIS